MAKRIGIIGAGTGGLHLGLRLRQHDVDATIITDRRPEEFRNGRLMNTVAHHGITVQRETDMGVNHWPVQEHGYFGHYHSFAGEHPLRFFGEFRSPSRAVDYRIYTPALMNNFEQRGGVLEYRQIREEDIPDLCSRFDLLVVCVGKNALSTMFGPDPSVPAFQKPLRQLCAGLYRGVADTEPRAVTFSVSPGHGEMIEIPMQSFEGRVTALLFENIAGGDLEELARFPVATDPKGFRELVLRKLRSHHAATFERVKESEFDLCGLLDVLQGAVVPTVRTGFQEIAAGKFAIALGDFHVTVDPVIGQGANMASHSAWVLAEAVASAEVFDRAFCERVDAERKPRILSAFHWTNFMLQPPSQEFLGFVFAMSQNKALCDEFTHNFSYPEQQWEHLKTPDRIAAWSNAKVSGAA